MEGRPNTLMHQAIRWLTAMRKTTGGFVSTIDSLLALEALTEFAVVSRVQVQLIKFFSYLICEIVTNF